MSDLPLARVVYEGKDPFAVAPLVGTSELVARQKPPAVKWHRVYSPGRDWHDLKRRLLLNSCGDDGGGYMFKQVPVFQQ